MTAAKTRAGGAYVEVSADETPLVKSIKGMGARFDEIGKSVTRVGAGISGVGAAVAGLGAAIVGPLKMAANQFADVGDQVHKMGLRVHASAEMLTELGFAAEQSGTNLEQVGAAIFRMNRRIANATSETGPAVRALQELGLSAEMLNNLSTEDRFLKIADVLSKMEDETRAAQMGFEIFGDNFRQLQPLINEGAAGINKLRAEARELGITLSQDDADAAAALGDAMNRVTRTVQANILQLGAAIAPVLTAAADRISEITRITAKWIKNNKEIVVSVLSVGGALAGIGTAIVTIGGGVAGLGFAISGVSTAFAAVGSVVAAVGAPVIGTIAAITAGVTALGAGLAYVLNEAGLLMPIINGVGQAFNQAFALFKQTFGGILQALGSGEFAKAAQIAWAGVELATLKGAQLVLKGVDYLWNNATKITVSFFSSLAKLVGKVFASLPKIAFAALQGGTAFQRVLNKALASAFSGNSLAEGLDPAIEAAQNRLNQLTGQQNPVAQAGQGAGQSIQDLVKAEQERAAAARRAQQAAGMRAEQNRRNPQPPQPTQLAGGRPPREIPTRPALPGLQGAASAAAPKTETRDFAALLKVAEQQLFVLRRIQAGGLA